MRVVVVVVVFVVRLVVALKVVVDPGGRDWTAQRADDEDGGDEQRKDLVGEARRVLDDAVETPHRGQDHVHRNPKTDPGIEGEERDAHALGHFEENLRKGQNGTRSTIDHHGLTTNESVDDATPRGGNDHFHGPDPVFRRLAVHRAKGDCRSDAGEEEEERNRNRFLVEVLHLLTPPGSYRRPKVAHDTSTPAAAPLAIVTTTFFRSDRSGRIRGSSSGLLLVCNILRSAGNFRCFFCTLLLLLERWWFILYVVSVFLRQEAIGFGFGDNQSGRRRLRIQRLVWE